jgi:hypothetical protein
LPPFFAPGFVKPDERREVGWAAAVTLP